MMYSLAPPSIAREMWSMLVSVVQNTTLGVSPPGMRRRWPRNLVAVDHRHVPVEQDGFRHGAFADDKRRRHRLRPRRPEKDISSRMRRAIFAYDAGIIDDETRFSWLASLSDKRRMPIGLCCKGYFGHDFEDAIDVEDDHELAVEPV